MLPPMVSLLIISAHHTPLKEYNPPYNLERETHTGMTQHLMLHVWEGGTSKMGTPSVTCTQVTGNTQIIEWLIIMAQREGSIMSQRESKWGVAMCHKGCL